MNTINIHHVKIQKANTALSYRKLKKATNYFRIIEFFLLLVMISKFAFHLPPSPPTLLRLSIDYLHHLCAILLSPRFVFVLGNAIVVILIINSGKFSNRNTTSTASCTSKTQKSTKAEVLRTGQRKQGKQVREKTEVLADTIITSIFPSSIENVKIYKRSKSDKLINPRVPCEKRCKDLQRANTSGNLRGAEFGCCKEAEDPKGIHFPEDRMSNEEFRQTIEDFIARQQRILREEEFSIVGFRAILNKTNEAKHDFGAKMDQGSNGGPMRCSKKKMKA